MPGLLHEDYLAIKDVSCGAGYDGGDLLMPELEFDHLVIAAADLDTGMAYIRETLGVDIPAGGQHHFMGTHNAVMAVGEGIYLELISIDPELPAPSGPRWFGLDTEDLQDRLKTGPVLVHYVLRTDDMAATLDGLDPALRHMLGPAMSASRGDLRWQITLNNDGIPPAGGCIPAIIEWQGTPPQYGMEFPGPVLQKLDCRHPDPDQLGDWLEMLGAGYLLQHENIVISSAATSRLTAEFAMDGRSFKV